MFWPLILGILSHNNLLPLDTIETITDVQVEELWTKTVNKIPIISPTIGLASNGFPWNMEPVKMKECKKVCKWRWE